jgi:hypothetical protein
MSCFSFLFFLLQNSGNKRAEQVLPKEEGWLPVRGERWLGKGVGG